MPVSRHVDTLKFKITKKALETPKKASKITDEILEGYEIRIEEDILTSDAVALILNSSKKIVERELRLGKLKGTKRIGKWFILKSDLIAYIRSGGDLEDNTEDETDV